MSNIKTHKTKSKESKVVNERYSVSNALINYYLVVMFTVFPLYFSDAYFNIRKDKYFFFLVLTGIAVFAELAVLLNNNLETKPKSVQSQQGRASWYNTLSVPDWGMIVFLFVSLISTVLSKTPTHAFLGTGGRNSGLLLIAFYVGVYFLVSRVFYYKEYIFLAFGGASAIVYILAVLNSFYIDPLSMSVELSQRDLPNFVSTIGNKNMLSSYICVSLPVFIAMSVYTRKISNQIIYLATSGLGFTALMAADSDSGILGVVAFFAIYLVWYSRKLTSLKRFFLVVFVMLASAKSINIFMMLCEKNKGFDSFQIFFISSNAGHLLLFAIAIITLILYLIDMKKPGIILPKAVPIALCGIFVVAIIAVIVGVIYFTFIDTETKLKNLAGLLRINDKWGTHRGYMWIRSMQIFFDSSFIEKLFGCGPDCFYFAFQPYFEGLKKFGDSSTNAAHNEYINYLITTGLFGLMSYLSIVISVITRAVKSAKKNPIVVVFVAAVICYSVQAVVNISQPITTPLFVLFLALCEAMSRKTKA